MLSGGSAGSSECTLTHMPSRPATLSTSDSRRPVVLASAIRAFARAGYAGTTIADVGREADISAAYVFKLYPSKEILFVAALERCYELVEEALEAGAQRASGIDAATPTVILDAMGGAYAALVADRDLLMLQVHAQAAAGSPVIAAAVRAGVARITTLVKARSGAPDADVQRFMAFGQLCHLIVTVGIEATDGPWAEIIAAGIRHP